MLTILKLKTCRLRHWSKEDAPTLARHANNRKIWLNLRDAFPHPYLPEHAVSFLKNITGQLPQTTFAIEHSGEAIGCIGLNLRDDVHRKTAELGYWLAEPFWNRGIMTEAVTAFTQQAFGHFDLMRIHAEPFADNGGSVKVLEKAGFICEGRLSKSAIKDGRILDQLLYARVI